MKSKFARKVHLASTQTEFPSPPPHTHTLLLLPLLSIGKFVAGNVRILLAWAQGRSVQRGGEGGDCQVLGRCPPAACWLCHASKRNQFPLENWFRPLPWAQVSSCCTNKYFPPDVWVTIAPRLPLLPSPPPSSLPILSRCLFAATCKTLNISTFKR